MSDTPAGTIGFEAVGDVEDDDWEEMVEPVLRREIADGRQVRLLYVLGPEARDVEGDAMSADAGFRARRPTSFERVGGGQRRGPDAARAACAVVPASRDGQGLPRA
jgi:hypothetical protein